jgi:hypothetical protein
MPTRLAGAISSAGSLPGVLFGIVLVMAMLGYHFGSAGPVAPSKPVTGKPSNSAPHPSSSRAPAPESLRLMRSIPQQAALGDQSPHLTSAPEKQSCRCDISTGGTAAILPPNSLVNITQETEVENRRTYQWQTVKYYHVVAINPDGSPQPSANGRPIEGWGPAGWFSPAGTR